MAKVSYNTLYLNIRKALWISDDYHIKSCRIIIAHYDIVDIKHMHYTHYNFNVFNFITPLLFFSNEYWIVFNLS